MSGKNIYLIGYRGVGKTTVAQILSQKLNRSWCDADALLEEKASKTIRQIFAEEGEGGFRDRESAVLRELAVRNDLIVATGGGVILREENRSLLKQGIVVWLTASTETIWSRLSKDSTTQERRPNLSRGGIEEIEELLRSRVPLYQACADFKIDADARSSDEIALEIVKKVTNFVSQSDETN